MTKQVQRRRGTATQHTSFTGAEGEVSVNTTNKSIHVHDGVTAGGIEGARADMTNVSDGDLNSRLAGNTLSSLTITSADINGGTIDGTVIGGTTPAAGNFTTGSFTGNATFGDNDKAIFGAGSDLQIYHDGSNSYVKDAGDGVLNVQGSSQVNIGGANGTIGVQFVEGANVTLRHNNSPKLATTSTGIDVTGTVIADSANITGTVTADGLTVGPNDSIIFGTANTTGIYRTNSGNDLTMQHWGNLSMLIDSDNNDANNRQFLIGRNSQDASTALKIALFSEGGDISFYEDTGTTPKFFWDASAESLAVGGSSGYTAAKITGVQQSDTAGVLSIGLGAGGGTAQGFRLTSSNAIAFDRYNAGWFESMRIDSSGNVGIGTSSPAASLHVANPNNATIPVFIGSNLNARGLDIGSRTGSDFANITFTSDDGATPLAAIGSVGDSFRIYTGGNTAERMRIDSSGNLLVGTTSNPSSSKFRVYGISEIDGLGVGLLQFKSSGTAIGRVGQGNYVVSGGPPAGFGMQSQAELVFGSGGTTERMRIDSSGNVLVGTTSSTGGITATSGSGFVYRPTKELTVHRQGSGASSPVAIFNQTGDDGQILDFRKDGTTVGSIGTNAGNIYLTDGARSLIVDGDTVKAGYSTGGNADAAQNLGSSSVRFKDLYLSGGVYLGGTGAANKLDDYEEGTFTPTFVGSTGGTVTLGGPFDKYSYTKIGRVVTVTGRVDVSGTPSLSGNLIFQGLPFSVGDLTDASGTSVQYAFITIGSATTGNPVVVELNEGTTQATIRAESWNSAAGILVNNSRIQMSITYFTS